MSCEDTWRPGPRGGNRNASDRIGHFTMFRIRSFSFAGLMGAVGGPTEPRSGPRGAVPRASGGPGAAQPRHPTGGRCMTGPEICRLYQPGTRMSGCGVAYIQARFRSISGDARRGARWQSVIIVPKRQCTGTTAPGRRRRPAAAGTPTSRRSGSWRAGNWSDGASALPA